MTNGEKDKIKKKLSYRLYGEKESKIMFGYLAVGFGGFLKGEET